ncbi:hypothetical protein [uncultured Azohydromonas sp.]|nr:hypothetical protein [uncultured Azohydromonas sp.]
MLVLRRRLFKATAKDDIESTLHVFSALEKADLGNPAAQARPR